MEKKEGKEGGFRAVAWKVKYWLDEVDSAAELAGRGVLADPRFALASCVFVQFTCDDPPCCLLSARSRSQFPSCTRISSADSSTRYTHIHSLRPDTPVQQQDLKHFVPVNARYERVFCLSIKVNRTGQIPNSHITGQTLEIFHHLLFLCNGHLFFFFCNFDTSNLSHCSQLCTSPQWRINGFLIKLPLGL